MTMKPFLFKPAHVRPAAMIADACHSPTHGRGEVGARRAIAVVFAAMLSLSAMAAIGQDAAIDWWSVDGGGEIRSEGGVWTLSGTLGQWDSTEGNIQSGGSWQLTGGFWAIEAPASDGLFIDSFEN